MIDLVAHPVATTNDLGNPRAGPQICGESERLRPFQQITLQLFSGLGIQLIGAARCRPGEDSVASVCIKARTPSAHRSSINEKREKGSGLALYIGCFRCISIGMSRPLRIECPGAFYHLTARGDRREGIYEGDEDRKAFFDILRDVIDRFEWRCHAYCQMTNHYHLFVETVHGNLSKGMRQLNGVYTQWSNRHHQRSGHLFQGRFKGILVDSDPYLQTLGRYIVLNPARAGIVDDPADWPWSSYRATAGLQRPPGWLTTETILGAFGKKKGEARKAYRRFVREGIGKESIWAGLNRRVFLGDDRFVERMQGRLGDERDDVQIPKEQRRRPPPSLEQIHRQADSRDAAIVAAHATGEYSYSQIGAFFGLHFATVGRIVRKQKAQQSKS
jgi:putative transposase